MDEDFPTEEVDNEEDLAATLMPDDEEVAPALLEEAEPELEVEGEDETLPDDLAKALLDLTRICELEDLNIRLTQVQKWKRLELYFNNLTNVFWDSGASNWRIPQWDDLEDGQDFAESRTINIYRAHAEAVIAAASIKVPGVVFFPKDADSIEDIESAITRSKISRLVQKQNKSQLLFMKALAIFFNEGTVFSYSLAHESNDFGKRKQARYAKESSNSYELTCPNCGADLGATNSLEELEPIQCPECGEVVTPEVETKTAEIDVPAGYDILPKSGVRMSVYGPLDCKVAFYARSQSDTGYLIYKHAQAVAFLREAYPHIASQIVAASGDSYDDDWMRLPVIYQGLTPDNTAVVRCVWFRPWQFNGLEERGEDSLASRLKEKFPKGCYCVFINDVFAEAYEEDLDDHWTISQSPLSKTIHGEPLGTNLAVIQDLRSEVMELKLQTMEHGISEVFADSAAINFNAYKDSQARPGTVYPLKRDPGERAGDLFYETRTATLSPEVSRLQKDLDEDAQFTTGSQPSIYGGSVGGGTTATEYKMSRAQALQRLGLVWQLISNWWAESVEKATAIYADHLSEDENYVTSENGGFQNNRISKASLTGEIQSVEPDFSDQLPLTWEQKHDVIMGLFQMGNPMVDAVLTHPVNNQLIKQATGLQELYIPGEDQRNKQYYEAALLFEQEPTKDGQGQDVPSIMPDGEDDDPIHIQICKAILVSLKGLRTKEERPSGFRNLQLHLEMHQQRVAQKAQQGNETPQGQPVDSAAPNTIS
jgi:DNA-directed RNA polymerase subunit RPC12/RpoP